MLIIGSDVHQQHHCLELTDGQVAPSIEGPQRADLIADALREAGHTMSAPDPVDMDLLAQIHTPEYLAFLETAWSRWQDRENPGPAAMGFTWPSRGLESVRPDDLIGQLGFHSFAADCSIVAGTWAAATEGVAIATTAAERMLTTGAPTFGLCRPPGHHATADQFGGYCFLNNAAAAAQHLRNRGAERVAVLDVDYHHGNGTQSIFYQRADVLFVSLHADPLFEFPWFAGHSDETGHGIGEGWNVNLPLQRGDRIDVYLQALEQGLQRVEEARVDALVISLGVDTFSDDPLGTFHIETPDFQTIARRIAAANIPTTIVLEGGYAVEEIGLNVAAFLRGFETD